MKSLDAALGPVGATAGAAAASLAEADDDDGGIDEDEGMVIPRF